MCVDEARNKQSTELLKPSTVSFINSLFYKNNINGLGSAH